MSARRRAPAWIQEIWLEQVRIGSDRFGCVEGVAERMRDEP